MPDDDVIARGRAIFERLRAVEDEPAAAPPADDSADPAVEPTASEAAPDDSRDPQPAAADDTTGDGPDAAADGGSGEGAPMSAEIAEGLAVDLDLVDAGVQDNGAEDDPERGGDVNTPEESTASVSAAVRVGDVADPGAADGPEAALGDAPGDDADAAADDADAEEHTADRTEPPVGVEAAAGDAGEEGEPSEVGEVGEVASVLAPVVDPAFVEDPAGAEAPPAVEATEGERDAAAATVAEPAPPVAAPERPPSPFARPLPRVLAIANQKGGVGKTTTAVNMSAALAELGYRVLVLDLDPQGNATTGLGVNARNLDTSIYDVIVRDAAIEDCIEPTSIKNLFVVPATLDLAGAEIELVSAFSRELKLRKALEPIHDDFDFVFIDCPPSIGLLTINAFAVATEVLVPIQCEYYALEGLGQLMRSVNLVQANLNPKLEIGAIVLTMYDARTKLAEQVAQQVRQHFGAKVCRHVVPRTVRLSEAPSYGQPITVFDPTSRGAIAYRELAKEVSGGAPQRVG